MAENMAARAGNMGWAQKWAHSTAADTDHQETEPTAQPAFDIIEASAVVPEIDQQTRLSPGVQAQKSHLRQAQPPAGQSTRLSPNIVAGQAGALRHDVGVISEDVERTHGDPHAKRHQHPVSTELYSKNGPSSARGHHNNNTREEPCYRAWTAALMW